MKESPIKWEILFLLNVLERTLDIVDKMLYICMVWKMVSAMSSLITMETFLVIIPRTFYYDRESRELGNGVLIRGTRHGKLCRMTHEELEELESDAMYYSDSTGFEGTWPGLHTSAQLTLSRIEEAKKNKQNNIFIKLKGEGI